MILCGYCIHQSSGYYAYGLGMPPLLPAMPPQCAERFLRYHSNAYSFLSRAFIFTGYALENLAWEYFWPRSKNKMAITVIFFFIFPKPLTLASHSSQLSPQKWVF